MRCVFERICFSRLAGLAQNSCFGDFPAALFYPHRDEDGQHQGTIRQSHHELRLGGWIGSLLDHHLGEFPDQGRAPLGAIGFTDL